MLPDRYANSTNMYGMHGEPVFGIMNDKHSCSTEMHWNWCRRIMKHKTANILSAAYRRSSKNDCTNISKLVHTYMQKLHELSPFVHGSGISIVCLGTFKARRNEEIIYYSGHKASLHLLHSKWYGNCKNWHKMVIFIIKTHSSTHLN